MSGDRASSSDLAQRRPPRRAFLRGNHIVHVPWVFWIACLMGVWCGAPAGAEELRDPFTFGARIEGAEHTAPVLMGIVWDPKTPLAVFGSEMVNIGAVVNGWQIVQIQHDGILVQRQDHRQFIPIGAALPTD